MDLFADNFEAEHKDAYMQFEAQPESGSLRALQSQKCKGLAVKILQDHSFPFLFDK